MPSRSRPNSNLVSASSTPRSVAMPDARRKIAERQPLELVGLRLAELLDDVAAGDVRVVLADRAPWCSGV